MRALVGCLASPFPQPNTPQPVCCPTRVLPRPRTFSSWSSFSSRRSLRNWRTAAVVFFSRSMVSFMACSAACCAITLSTSGCTLPNTSISFRQLDSSSCSACRSLATCHWLKGFGWVGVVWCGVMIMGWQRIVQPGLLEPGSDVLRMGSAWARVHLNHLPQLRPAYNLAGADTFLPPARQPM